MENTASNILNSQIKNLRELQKIETELKNDEEKETNSEKNCDENQIEEIN